MQQRSMEHRSVFRAINDVRLLGRRRPAVRFALRISLLSAVCAAQIAMAAPAREIVQMQRDLAQLQEQVRTLQRTVDDRMATLTTLVQQALEASGKTNTSVAVLESGLRDRLSQQLATPMAGMSAKVDQMSSEFTAVRESIADMNERLGKLQAQIVDLGNTVKIMQAPPPPPGAAGTTGPGGSAAAGPPPGVSAKQLYETALRDRSGGNFDLALQGFQEYLKWFPSTELAPNAQFYIGEILYDRNDFQGAIQAYDTVLERFPENNKTADALFKKGMALLKSGQRNQAAQEFLAVVQKYPNAEVTAKARAQRKALGLSSPAAAPASRRHR